MTDEFDFFNNDSTKWNYKPYNAVIMLKEIFKHNKQYLENDVTEWIIKKAL